MSELKATAGEWKAGKVPLTEMTDGTLKLTGYDEHRWYIRCNCKVTDIPGISRVTTYVAHVDRCGDMSDEELAANAHGMAAWRDLYAALEDMLSGWRYIREQHGDLYGVGWDRAENAAKAALAKARGDIRD